MGGRDRGFDVWRKGGIEEWLRVAVGCWKICPIVDRFGWR